MAGPSPSDRERTVVLDCGWHGIVGPGGSDGVAVSGDGRRPSGSRDGGRPSVAMVWPGCGPGRPAHEAKLAASSGRLGAVGSSYSRNGAGMVESPTAGFDLVPEFVRPRGDRASAAPRSCRARVREPQATWIRMASRRSRSVPVDLAAGNSRRLAAGGPPREVDDLPRPGTWRGFGLGLEAPKWRLGKGLEDRRADSSPRRARLMFIGRTGRTGLRDRRSRSGCGRWNKGR